MVCERVSINFNTNYRNVNLTIFHFPPFFFYSFAFLDIFFSLFCSSSIFPSPNIFYEFTVLVFYHFSIFKLFYRLFINNFFGSLFFLKVRGNDDHYYYYYHQVIIIINYYSVLTFSDF